MTTHFTYPAEIRKTLRLAFPIVIAQLGVILMGVTDNIMVGRFIGKVALGSAGVANSIAFLIGCLAIGGLAVVAPLVSKAKAEGNEAELNRLYRASLWAATGFSVVLTLGGLLAMSVFEWFGQPAVTNQQAPYFLLIITLANIPLFYFTAIKQFTDGLSLTSVAMVITAAGLLFNIFGNYLFINGLAGFPKWGLYGSAYSTLLTRLLMLLAMWLYVSKNQGLATYFKAAYNQLPVQDLVKTIYQLGIPSGLQFFFEIGAFSFAVVMMGWLGEVEMAAHQVAINIASTTYMMATGIAFAGGIRVGEGRGLRSNTHVRMAGNVAFLLVAVFMTFAAVIILLLDETLVSVYINEPDVLHLAVELLLIASIFQLSDGLQVAALSALRGLSDVNIPTIVTLVAYWVIALPVGYWLAFQMSMRAHGIWIGLLLGLTASALMLIARFYWLVRRTDYSKSTT